MYGNNKTLLSITETSPAIIIDMTTEEIQKVNYSLINAEHEETDEPNRRWESSHFMIGGRRYVAMIDAVLSEGYAQCVLYRAIKMPNSMFKYELVEIAFTEPEYEDITTEWVLEVADHENNLSIQVEVVETSSFRSKKAA